MVRRLGLRKVLPALLSLIKSFRFLLSNSHKPEESAVARLHHWTSQRKMSLAQPANGPTVELKVWLGKKLHEMKRRAVKLAKRWWSSQLGKGQNDLENAEPVQAESWIETPMGPDMLSMSSLVDQRVIIDGLKSRPELNGTKGIVTEFHEDISRYTVRCDLDGSEAALKPENCLPMAKVLIRLYAWPSGALFMQHVGILFAVLIGCYGVACKP